MQRKMIGFLVFIMCTLMGCSQQTNKPIESQNTMSQNADIDISKVKEIGSKIKENELYVASENINLCFCKNFTHTPYFVVDCLSSSEIDTEKVEVYIDIDTPYNISITEVKDEAFDLYSFGLFTGYDGKKANKLREENEEEFNQYQNIFLKAYNQMLENEIGELHHYIVTITLDLEHSIKTETFHNIQIEYDGKKIDKQIGNIVIDCDKKNPKKENSLYASCFAINDIYIGKNSEGQMNLINSNMYKTKKAVNLSNIYMLNKDTNMQNCNVSIHSQRENYDMKWIGEKIEVEPNSDLGLDLLLIRDDFREKVYYQYSDYLVVEYQEGKEKYKTGTELYFSTKLTGYQLYAYFLDGIEIESE